MGLAYVNRGSTAFLLHLQARIILHFSNLKLKDLSRCIYGLSLLPPQKRNEDLLQNLISKIKLIEDLESLPLIDLVTLLQAFTNLDPESGITLQA